MAQILLFPHIPGMGKKLSKWRVTRIRGSRADRLDVVEATTADEAIKHTIKKLQIKDPLEQKRIAAMPDGGQRR